MLSLEKILSHLKKMDWALVFLAVLLTCVGLISIYSSSNFRGDFSNFYKQIFFLILGLILMFVFSFVDWRMFRENPYFLLTIYFINVFALGFLLFLGPIIKGTKGWYKIGPFSFDPIESLKLILILLLAKYFSMRHVEMYNVKHILVSGIYVFFPCLLIFFQPDLGSVFLLFLLWLAILIISGIELRHFLILILAALFVFAFSWNHFLKDYQRARIISFIAPHIEPLGIGWTSLQSKIAIGSGEIWGKGFQKGTQVQFGFLTAPQTDFIFAALAEEFGLMGVTVLFLLLIFLFWRIIKIAFKARTNFPRLFATGTATLFVLEVFIHIGMNLGLLPVIGISLPFVSYGGSGLLLHFVGLGILQSFKIFQE